MGLLQQAIKTYDAMEKAGLVGKYEDDKEPLAPIGHILAKTQIIVTIDKEGHFISAEAADVKTIIPVTEESSGRTSAPVAHPLCDNIKYIANLDEKSEGLYLNQIDEWKNSKYGDPTLDAISEYVHSGTILQDLEKSGLIKRNPDGKVQNDKDMINWRVLGLDDSFDGMVFKNTSLMEKYVQYYVEKKGKTEKQGPCYITGHKDLHAIQHLKGIVSINGNAKIISANDKDNFTYRGRFVSDDEALSVGYLASQKGHNALKWVVANQRVLIGNRAFISWNPEGKKIPPIQSPLLWANAEQKVEPSNYKKELLSILMGYKNRFDASDEVVTASFDAATTGRLAVTYYNEMKCDDFLERLKDWDETCCWFDNKYGAYAPTLKDIVEYSFGYQRGNEDNARFELDNRVYSQQMHRMIYCRIEGAHMPLDFVKAISERASNLQILNRHNRQRLLFTACAVIRKYYYDSRKEEFDMALETDKKDRSYQYGRLLAVLEKIEKDTYDSSEKRETNAIRMQSVFVKRPAYATKIVLEQLKNSYYPRLSVGGRVYYEKLIGDIFSEISEFPDSELNKPLSETYIVGYYLQKNSLFTKKENMEVNEDE